MMTLTFGQRQQISLRVLRAAYRIALGRKLDMIRPTGEFVLPISDFGDHRKQRARRLALKHRLKAVVIMLRAALEIMRGRHLERFLRDDAVLIPVPELAAGHLTSEQEPRALRAAVSAGRCHTQSPHRWLRRADVPAGRPVCLFVTYSPDARLWPHVLNYMKQLKRQEFHVCLVAATDRQDLGLCDPGSRFADAVLVKKNEGFDFACWALALSSEPDLWQAGLLLLANDSVYGPFKSFHGIVRDVLEADADFIGLTESFEIDQHYQSYFIAMKGEALTNAAMRRFWADIKCFENKTEVIRAYEIGLTQCALAAGLRTKALFPCPKHHARSRKNQLLYDWRGLIERGMPFVKVSVLRDAGRDPIYAGWRELLREHGYDDDLVSFHLGAVKPETPVLAVP